MKNSLLPLVFATILGPSAFAQTVLFDFGRHNASNPGLTDDGNPSNNTGVENPADGDVVGGTISGGVAVGSATPVGGNGTFYWNSLGGTEQDQDLSNPTFTGFVDTNNNALTGWTISSLSNNTQSNGFLNGGLISPSSGNLGTLAVANATGDYWFVQGGNGTTVTFTLSGLNNDLTYDFTFFGSRVSTAVGDNRSTIYSADGQGAAVSTTALQTTGQDIGSDGIYDGNDDEVRTLTGIAPDAGSISLSFTVANGGFGYLNAMEVTVVPEPQTLLLAAMGGGFLLWHRRRAA